MDQTVQEVIQPWGAALIVVIVVTIGLFSGSMIPKVCQMQHAHDIVRAYEPYACRAGVAAVAVLAVTIERVSSRSNTNNGAVALACHSVAGPSPAKRREVPVVVRPPPSWLS